VAVTSEMISSLKPPLMRCLVRPIGMRTAGANLVLLLTGNAVHLPKAFQPQSRPIMPDAFAALQPTGLGSASTPCIICRTGPCAQHHDTNHINRYRVDRLGGSVQRARWDATTTGGLTGLRNLSNRAGVRDRRFSREIMRAAKPIPALLQGLVTQP